MTKNNPSSKLPSFLQNLVPQKWFINLTSHSQSKRECGKWYNVESKNLSWKLIIRSTYIVYSLSFTHTNSKWIVWSTNLHELKVPSYADCSGKQTGTFDTRLCCRQLRTGRILSDFCNVTVISVGYPRTRVILHCIGNLILILAGGKVSWVSINLSRPISNARFLWGGTTLIRSIRRWRRRFQC